MNEKVSIIVPVYNGERYIDGCIDNLLKQTYNNLEIIFVNDGSKDATKEILDRYVEKDSRIKVIHQNNTGPSGARNTGILNATGEYILFSDVDDEVEDNLVKDNVELARKNNADVVMFNFWYYFVDTDTMTPNAYNEDFAGNGKQYFEKYLKKTMDTEIYNAPWNKLIRKTLLTDNNIFFDERYSIIEDVIFSSNVIRISEKIVINSKRYYKYFVRSSGSLITKFFENTYDCVLEAYNSGMNYCSRFTDNEIQKRCFDELLLKYTMPYLKQISLESSITNKKKIELIRRIVLDSSMAEAIRNVEFHGRKKIIATMIRRKKVKTICCYYRLLAKFRRDK